MRFDDIPDSISPPGFIFQNGFYICMECGCLLSNSWTILQAHKDYHEYLKDIILRLDK